MTLRRIHRASVNVVDAVVVIIIIVVVVIGAVVVVAVVVVVVKETGLRPYNLPGIWR